MSLQRIRLRGRSQIPLRPRRRGLLGLVLLLSFVVVVVVVAISCCTSPQCDVTAFTFTFAAAFAFGSPPAPARSKKKHGTTTPSLSFLKRTLPPLNNNNSPSNNEEEKDHDHDHDHQEQEEEQEEDFSWRMSMESLKSRTKELLNAPQSIPLVMIPGGCILPRQVVTVKIQSPDFLSQVILRQKDTDIPRFGLVAVVRGKNATTSTNSNNGGSGSGSETAAVKEEFLPIGVEVEVLSANPVMIQNVPTSNKFSRSSTNPDDKNEPNTTPEALVEMKVRGIRTFEIVDMPTTTTTTAAPDMTNRNNNKNKNKWQQQGWIPDAKVQYLDFQRLEAAEPDTFNVALAMQQAQEFTDTNNSMKESKNLVEMWLDLARGVNERQHEKQLDMLLEELGEMPSWEEPSECAYWVAALINPTPSMDLAVDIRMGLLTSHTALERTQLVLNALWNSIQRMDASTTPRFFQIHTE